MPINEHDALVKPEEGLIIWRYMNLSKFESLLKEKALFFCRSDKFADPYEASIPKRQSDARVHETLKIARFFNNDFSWEEAVKKSKQIGDFHKELRKSFIVNCWHINPGESDAMWQLYISSNEGVAIRPSPERLSNSFQESTQRIFMTKVRYLDYETDIWYNPKDYPITNYNIFSPILHKRKAYSHENELRVFQQLNEAEGNDFWSAMPNNKGQQVKCDLDSLIESVILPPTCDDKVENKVRSLLHSYGLDKPIERSKLDDEPYY